MLLSKKLFNEFFPKFEKISNQEFEVMLNSIGIEVESIFKFEETKNLIVGEITKVEKHPNANKLNVCEVNFENKVHTIICGASNVKVGLKVIVAKVGTKMLDGRVIEARDVRGIKSNGMICAYSELTNRSDFLPESEKDEIIELDSNAKLNDNNPLKYIGLDDEIFDLSIPSNRNELNSIIGLGFDLISIYFPEITLNYDLNFSKNKKNDYKINILNNEACSFFGTILLKNLKLKKSSWKVKYLLMNSGFIPKNVVVDICNLNTIITGNPSHCYDADTISKNISIDFNKEKTHLSALNNNGYDVAKKEGVFVYSEKEPIALGCMIGSKKTAISDTTENVLFELGNFNNLYIRKLNDKLNLKTDAANLASKKIPLWITLKSFDTLISLLIKANANFEGISYTNYKLINKTIKYDYKKIISLLGNQMEEKKLLKQLNSMGLKVEKNNIIIPIYREDIDTINDVVEEVVKKIDINNLKEAPILQTEVDFDFDVIEDNKTILETKLLNKGLSLVKTLNLCSKQKNEEFNLFETKKWVQIINPISNEREYFRNNLIEQHLNVLAFNSARKNKMLNIFEIQGLNYDETWKQHLCITLSEPLYINKVSGDKIKNDLLTLKSLVTDILSGFGLKPKFKELKIQKDFILKNNAFSIYVNNKLIGHGGQINPYIAKNYNYINDNAIYFLEVDINGIIEKTNDEKLIVKTENEHHNIKRLLTINIAENNNYTDIEKIFNDYLNKNIISDLELETVYQKDEKKAYTFSFVIESKFLKSEQSNEILEKIINSFEKENMKINR